MRNGRKHCSQAAAAALVSLMLIAWLPGTTLCYSVLTHEAIIDSVWDASIKPLLIKRFQATPEQLREARSYAYGGAIIQDMGYYPFGSKFFTDLVHYVRSGDFIGALIAESQDLNEYSFALGALAHYAADNEGHSLGINRAVPLLYPKLRAKHGPIVTYADDSGAHLKTEFGFDVVQVARGRYAPDSYHDFIGFRVSKEVLERAFKRTYGMELKDLFQNLDLSIATFRRSVSTIIPHMTEVAWELKKDEIMKASPGLTREKFVYVLQRDRYEQEWGNSYEKPGVMAKATAMLLRILPKVGPLKVAAFKTPTPEAERLFMTSLEATLARYRGLLAQVPRGRLNLENLDFDTGRPTRAGEYEMADEAYAELLQKLERERFRNVSAELRQNILQFYATLDAPIATKKDREEWSETLNAIEQLKAIHYTGDTGPAAEAPVRKSPEK